ncbi:SCO family protein [Microlunatus sp. Y2014]|uniref:SCO family protein n=1 Tax=Microlunatus sp. Y2014 TaxID=3418488 RepID=UPI003DA73187
MSRTLRPAVLAVVTVLLFAVAGCVAPTTEEGPVVVNDPGDDGWGGTRVTTPYEVPDLSLTDAHGQAYNLRTSPSTPVTLVFFGYTNCPDVCIAVLSDVAMALKRSDPGVADRITMVFVTTDPNRDTPDVIKAYLDRFDPTFVGLTGEMSDIKALAKPLGVSIEGMKKLPSGGYEVGHGAQVIGINAQDQGVVVWTPGTPIGDLMADYQRLVAEQ